MCCALHIHHFPWLGPAGMTATLRDVASESRHGRHISEPDIGSLLQALEALTALDASDHVFRIEVYAEGVFSKLRRGHQRSGVLVVFETIDLCLQVVAVRVTVVETDSRAMVDAPVWFDAESLPLAVGQKEFRDVPEGEGDMLLEAVSWT